jgi:hypothetical protein
VTWDDDIDAPGGGSRLSRSTVTDAGVVEQTPASLVTQAERVLGGQRVELDLYTLARVIGSEGGSMPPAQLLVIGDCDLNKARAKGVSVTDHATARSLRYGKQGSVTSTGAKRPVATTRDPYIRHLRAAQLLTNNSGARGVSLGGVQYFDARTQLAMWAKGDASYMHPLDILRKWTFNLTVASRAMVDGRVKVTFATETAADRANVGPGELELVFPEGVDPWRLFVFRPATSVARQAEGLHAAERVLQSQGAWAPRATPRRDDVEATVLAGALAAAVVAAQRGS